MSFITRRQSTYPDSFLSHSGVSRAGTRTATNGILFANWLLSNVFPLAKEPLYAGGENIPVDIARRNTFVKNLFAMIFVLSEVC